MPACASATAPLVGAFRIDAGTGADPESQARARGSIDFDLPEPLIEFDEFGDMTGVTRAAQHRAPHHRGVHAGGQRSRRRTSGSGRHSVHLSHPRKARPKARDGVRRGRRALRLLAGRRRDSGEALFVRAEDAATAAKCARKWCAPQKTSRISSRNYQKLVAKIEGKPEERILSYLMLRSLKQARYSTETTATLRWPPSLHALHFADPPLSRSDRASPPASLARRRTGDA